MFWENFYKLCENNNEKPLQVVKKIGIAAGSITKWKKGSIPSGASLSKISEYFGVTVDELLNDYSPTPVTASETQTLDQENLRMVPLYESVAAGFSAYASAEIQDYMPVYFNNPAEAEWTLCIKVKGDSMHPKIEDGDIIQVRKQEDVDSGSIAVVMVDEDGLVKVVWKEPDGVMLQSINPKYVPMHFQGKDAQRVRIVGIVTQIIKGVNGHKVNYISKDDGKKELMEQLEQMDAQQLREFNRIFNEYMRGKTDK